LTIAEYEEEIAEKLRSLDVAILVINAGVASRGEFTKINDLDV
jgi:short-subunit dehydrogenase